MVQKIEKAKKEKYLSVEGRWEKWYIYLISYLFFNILLLLLVWFWVRVCIMYVIESEYLFLLYSVSHMSL
jgi:hypothetical protein